MPYTGESGQYGGMPGASLRSKYEVTAMGDDADGAIGALMRDGLRDTSCSSTFFESDHKRDDTGSEERLSLRYNGHRSGERPDAPDLFLELTGRDPRGTAVGPDMQKLRDMAWDRKDSHRFYSDSDHSIQERVKYPTVLQEQLREQFEITKRRLKIFSTSRDQATTGSATTTMGESRPDQEDQTALSSREEILTGVRRQTAKAGELQLGWEQTSDLEIKVAGLGQVRSGWAQPENAAGNRRETAAAVTADSRVQVVKTGAASLMRAAIDRLDIERDQSASRSAATMTGTSRFAADTKSRVDTAAVATEKRREALGTVSRFIGQLRAESGMAGQDIETQMQVLQFMDNAVTASLASKQSRFAAEDIVMSARVAGTFAGREQKRAAETANPLAARRHTETARHHESMQVARLGSASMTQGRRVAAGGEGYKQQSQELATKRIVAPTLRDAHSGAESQAHDTFSTKSRSVRGLGSKYTREMMDTDRTMNAMSDMS